MSHTITVAEGNEYILLAVDGIVNRSTAMRYNLEAAALGKKLGIRRFLVDFSAARNTDTVLDQYNFAYKDMPQAEHLDRVARVAVLVAENDHSHDFVETLLQNAGFNVRLFNQKDLALNYLLHP